MDRYTAPASQLLRFMMGEKQVHLFLFFDFGNMFFLSVDVFGNQILILRGPGRCKHYFIFSIEYFIFVSV